MVLLMLEWSYFIFIVLAATGNRKDAVCTGTTVTCL